MKPITLIRPFLSTIVLLRYMLTTLVIFTFGVLTCVMLNGAVVMRDVIIIAGMMIVQTLFVFVVLFMPTHRQLFLDECCQREKNFNEKSNN